MPDQTELAEALFIEKFSGKAATTRAYAPGRVNLIGGEWAAEAEDLTSAGVCRLSFMESLWMLHGSSIFYSRR